MSSLTVIGHKAPDTDSVVSAVVGAYLYSQNGMEATPYIAGTPNKEAAFALEYFGVTTPKIKTQFEENEQVVIVDTNNPEELLDGLENAQIIAIIDHHKLSGLKTDTPLSVTMKPLGSTATILYQVSKEAGIELPKDMAGLLLSAILSDTLKFTSPTTTDEDRQAAQVLQDLSGEKIDTLAEKLFAAKSNLTGMSPKDILLSDSKVFELGTKKARVSVLETTNPENAKALAHELIEEMKNRITEESLDHMYFFVVDIMKSNATLFVPSEEEKLLAEKAFKETFNGDVLILPGVVSRKKQIVPKLEAAYA